MIFLKKRGGGQTIGFIHEQEARAGKILEQQMKQFEFYIWHGYLKPGWQSYN